jgi:hypothetical protein
MDQGILDGYSSKLRVIARGRNSKLKRFYLRVKSKKGSNVAVVALARKVLCILITYIVRAGYVVRKTQSEVDRSHLL